VGTVTRGQGEELETRRPRGSEAQRMAAREGEAEPRPYLGSPCGERRQWARRSLYFEGQGQGQGQLVNDGGWGMAQVNVTRGTLLRESAGSRE